MIGLVNKLAVQAHYNMNPDRGWGWAKGCVHSCITYGRYPVTYTRIMANELNYPGSESKEFYRLLDKCPLRMS